MKDFVSGHWTSVVALAASTLVIYAARLWVAKLPRSTRQVIADVEAEPSLGSAIPQREGML